MRPHDGSDSLCASNFTKISKNVQRIHRQGLDKRSGKKREGAEHGKAELTEIEKATQANSKVKSMLIMFLDIKGIVRREFVLAGQTVNSAYYCHDLWLMRENAQRLRSEPRRHKNWLLQHDNAPSHSYFFH
jgi:hypothetical protein